MIVPVLACLAGAVIGLQYNVFALLAALVVGTAAFVTVSLAIGHGLLGHAGLLVICVILAQAGFLVGVTGRGVFANIAQRFNASRPRQI